MIKAKWGLEVFSGEKPQATFKRRLREKVIICRSQGTIGGNTQYGDDTLSAAKHHLMRASYLRVFDLRIYLRPTANPLGGSQVSSFRSMLHSMTAVNPFQTNSCRSQRLPG